MLGADPFDNVEVLGKQGEEKTQKSKDRAFKVKKNEASLN